MAKKSKPSLALTSATTATTATSTSFIFKNLLALREFINKQLQERKFGFCAFPRIHGTLAAKYLMTQALESQYYL